MTKKLRGKQEDKKKENKVGRKIKEVVTVQESSYRNQRGGRGSKADVWTWAESTLGGKERWGVACPLFCPPINITNTPSSTTPIPSTRLPFRPNLYLSPRHKAMARIHHGRTYWAPTMCQASCWILDMLFSLNSVSKSMHFIILVLLPSLFYRQGP